MESLAELREKLTQLTPGTDEFNVIANRIAELESQLDPVELEAQVKDPEVVKGLEEFELFGAALRPFCLNDVSHKAIRSTVLTKVYEMMAENDEIKEHFEKVDAQYEEELTELRNKLNERETELSVLKIELYTAKESAEDLIAKRDAANAQLEEVRKENEQLQAKIVTLESSEGKTPVATVEKFDAEQYRLSLPMIYDVVNDNRGLKFTAKLVETEEEVTDYIIYKAGKYREVTAEEATTFRAAKEEQERDNADRARLLELEKQPVTVPSFRDDSTESSTEADSTEPRLAEESPIVAGQVSAEEFEKLKAEFDDVKFRVAALESSRAVA